MHKVFLDNTNTVDSIEWRHRGYTVQRNPRPIATQASFNEVSVSNYLIWRPYEDTSFAEAQTLDDARMAIEGDRNTAEGRHE